MKFKKICAFIFIIIYISMSIFSLCYSMKYPNDHSNIFSFIDGFTTNLSAISLGALAIYQSQKYKKESDEKDSTPILMLVPTVESFDLSLVDIIVTQSIANSMKFNFMICSLNKTISDFQIEQITFKDNGNTISTNKNCNHKSGRDSTYNGVFLPEVFYNISLNFPQACKNGELHIKFTFKNIYYVEYKKEIILSSDGQDWKIASVSKCTLNS